MTRFHIYLYGPADRVEMPAATRDLASPPRGSRMNPLATSFEAAAERLTAIAGASVEPDGSFACVSGEGGEQIFGMLYDAAERLQYVELQGAASLEFCRGVVQAICGDPQTLPQLTVMQLPARSLKSFQAFEATVWPAAQKSRDA